MRESNYTQPQSNRAVISITQMMYDRRALDTNSTLALLNNLCQLTYLTSTSPRIREVLTMDGGLERMLDILRESCLPREPTLSDMWGLNGPCTARTINVDRAISLRHSLAFQCVVNIGIRGNEAIRTRVVQAGALDVVAQILESWLKKNGIAVLSSSVGSQASADALDSGAQLPGVEARSRRRQGSSRHSGPSSSHNPSASARESTAQSSHNAPPPPSQPSIAAANATSHPPTSHAPAPTAHATPPQVTAPAPSQPLAIPPGPFGTGAPSRGLGQLMVNLLANRLQNRQPQQDAQPPQAPTRGQTGSSIDTDVDMADAETEEGGETDTAGGDTDTGADMAMDVEPDNEAGPSVSTTTPRARLTVLPMQIPRRSPEPVSEAASAATSNAASLSGDEPPAIPRARSDNSLATNAAVQAAAESGRPASGMARPAQLGAGPGQSLMHGVEHVEGMRGRRGTVVGRPLLATREQQRVADESEVSDHMPETDLAQVNALAAAANAAMEAAAAVPNQETGPQPAIVDGLAGLANDEPDPDVLAAEQARFDMEAGAPPGQPGAAQTPRMTNTDMQQQPTELAPQVPPAPPAQIIIANTAPRGFQDLASYVGVSLLLNPEGTNYSEDNILLALQLLAYLSKYPHVRATFHHPRWPMHRTFDLVHDDENPLPERPNYSDTPNIFSLVERFTFRPSPSDPLMFRIPNEIQYWAGVIMRNACRKDDAQGGIRQCAYMSCGRWEKFPREFAKCRRCRKAKYCSKECQSKAWSEGHRFWCSLRSEPEPSADANSGANGAAGGGAGGTGRRDPPPRRDNAGGDGDVDMADGDAVQQTPRAAARHHTHTAVPPVVSVADTTPPPAGASMPTLRRVTPMRRPFESLSLSDERERARLAMPVPNSGSATPPVPRPLPAFLKLGQPGGPSSTAEMNAAMARPSRARSATPQMGNAW
ncbi:hypothetical protein CcaverHIS002_0311960 [Cutaneotrichosporon cavernicola]|uniref:MYND-type domain-containing protein n=1 Tax=Cutaneotrichosporon cavernicola TaxID=279322 RepID=A0AA48QVB1_9TREE|nr:uncharacterized protein CcaverHIS019_0311820 [Cutaneotrichosporon cavernicola]BEI83328.1 hypothetical protein CcaverHIS002_0311960 [Cutaneotrichosporon cavernicola]BEI91112.1 hypothetical protein CcaverHIS019_0311820 [Cutaneotrichosporon cavernicola]BEI98889.1 hypothetical protein CcaverHIS631_0311880 [Cutaneotrichosporon cavernicola]BEJ06662.1 hypothetical protein CcaverHIS641_0311840 [Cutaneotrichosporon cavernicola]